VQGYHQSISLVLTQFASSSDILHPGRANISKEELRDKLSGMYKAAKDQVSVFGLRTQFGGGKTTGFALVYDSPEAMKKFEPNYRLVRVGLATKVERASRQQRTYPAKLPFHNSRLTMHPTLQESNARTGKRRYAALRRSRVRRRRRRNRRWLVAVQYAGRDADLVERRLISAGASKCAFGQGVSKDGGSRPTWIQWRHDRLASIIIAAASHTNSRCLPVPLQRSNRTGDVQSEIVPTSSPCFCSRQGSDAGGFDGYEHY
jgi:ribosomal protein S24E